jgi:hypothetical protein
MIRLRNRTCLGLGKWASQGFLPKWEIFELALTARLHEPEKPQVRPYGAGAEQVQQPPHVAKYR